MPPKKRGRKPKKRKAIEVEVPTEEAETRTQGDERQERVDELLSELDNEVDHQLVLLDKLLATVQKNIRAKHKQLLLKIPKFVQQMTLREFLAVGGDVSKAMAREADATSVVEEAKAMTSRNEDLTESTSLSLQAMAGSSQQESVTDTTMTSDTTLSLETPAAGKSLRPRRGKAACASTATTMRQSSRLRAQRDFMTMDTPMQTPAFRPGLKKGPKNVRGKERTVTMHISNDADYIRQMAHHFKDALSQSSEDTVPLDATDDIRQIQAMLEKTFGPCKQGK